MEVVLGPNDFLSLVLRIIIQLLNALSEMLREIKRVKARELHVIRIIL